jgi:fatty acid desaturase
MGIALEIDEIFEQTLQSELAKKGKAKLSEKELEAFGAEMDALRKSVEQDLGEDDVAYMRRMIRLSRMSEIVGRLLIHISLDPFTWMLGVSSLSFAKILENMEIGHNVMHGQYDWTRDPDLNSQNYEWDTVCDGDSWRRTHNFEHHTFTNILGKDRDYGYAVLRLSDDEPWKPHHRFQIAYFTLLTVLFQWGVGVHEAEIEKIRSGEKSFSDKKQFFKEFGSKAAKQGFKDYVFFPLLAGPFAPKVLLGNVLANGIRNVWAATIIFCGHFTEDAQTFTEEECENESRGHWYYRQLLGSSNFTGGKWLHILSGHLSYQIEHHLFPDIPSKRYPEMGLKVQEICERYGLQYNTAPFFDQYKTVLQRVWKYSFPEKESAMS